MKFIWYIFAGLAGGVLGGMGMGGGTILIPLLSIFYAVKQHTSQAINLVSFIPMAIIAVIIHLKNKMIEFNKILYVIIPGVIACIGGCYIAKTIDGDLLKRLFGGFLLLLSCLQVVLELRKVPK
jgi:uncharacterized membrane protein YfcA